MSIQAERDYAVKTWQPYLYTKPFNDAREFREWAVVLQVLGERLKAGSRVLDNGCGPGWTSLFLAKAGFDVVGVDVSDHMIEIARERSRRDNVPANFAVGDMESLSLDRKDFDAALYFDCLHHCPNFGEALKRTYEHLKPGGWLLLMETTFLHRFSPHAKQVTKEYGITELGFTRGQLRRALRAAGFTDVGFHHDPGPSYRGFFGLFKTALRLLGGHFFYFPQAKNIVLARKP